MKQSFEVPEIRMDEFTVEDVVTASAPGVDVDDGNFGPVFG